MRKLSDFILRQGGVVLALFLMLSLSPIGLAVAAGTIGSLDIIDGSVKTVDLGTGAVTKAKLAKNSVISAKIADGQVTSADIADFQVGVNDIADGAVTSAKMGGWSIDPDRIFGTAWTSLNDGAFSTLDADRFDGMDSDAFVRKSGDSMTGALQAPIFSYNPPRERVVVVQPSAWVPSSNGVDYTTDGAALAAPQGGTFYAPVYVPEGARLTSFSAYVWDNDPNGNIKLTLRQHVTPVGPDILTGGTPENIWMWLTSTLAGWDVDYDPGLGVNIRAEVGAGNVLLSGVVVRYTVTEAGD